MVIKDYNTWQIVKQEDNVKKGKLVRVQIGPGRFVKMYEQDAIAQGLLKPTKPIQKTKPAAGNKMRRPAGNKAAGVGGQTSPPPVEPPKIESPSNDDFTTIPGVGPATARALQARGITNFEQLRNAALRQAQDANTLDFLSAQARQAIERWMNG